MLNPTTLTHHQSSARLDFQSNGDRKGFIIIERERVREEAPDFHFTIQQT